jgi:hypothetical protein
MAFGMLTAGFASLARNAPRRVAVAAGVFGFACAIEWAEMAIYHFQFERADVRDDAIGVAAALVLVELAVQILSRTRRPA